MQEAPAGTGALHDRVLVVIPALDEEAHIARCLRSLVEGDAIAGRCPILVADGGSRDRTREIVTDFRRAWPNVLLVDNPGRIQAAAVNIALDASWDERTILIRCDAHARYPARYVERLVAALAEHAADSVVVAMDSIAEGGCFQRALAWVSDTRLGAGGAPHRGGTASGLVDHGHHAAFRFDTFRRLGGYDTGFRTNEDAEFDRRLAQSGGRIWLDAGIRVGYFPRRHPTALWRQYLRYGSGRARTCLKHRDRPRPRQIIPIANLVALTASAAAAPFTVAALAWPVLYGALLAGVGLHVAVRRRSACGLLAGPALGIMHIAWGLGFIGAVARRAAPR